MKLSLHCMPHTGYENSHCAFSLPQGGGTSCYPIPTALPNAACAARGRHLNIFLFLPYQTNLLNHQCKCLLP